MPLAFSLWSEVRVHPSAIRVYVYRPGQVAQLVEQRTENPRVGSSILPLATSHRLRVLHLGSRLTLSAGRYAHLTSEAKVSRGKWLRWIQSSGQRPGLAH